MAQFCIGKEDFKQLFEKNHRERLITLMGEFSDRLSPQDMLAQMESDTGAFAEAVAASTSRFTNKTENVEIITAFDLADFYFPDENSQVCLEVKDGFPDDAPVSYESIVANIESNTPIDCSIKSGGREFHFQIKRYPQKYRAHTREALVEFIAKTMRGYTDMKGSILAVILQPASEEANGLSFKEVHEDLIAMKDEITFDEIDLIFNDRGQQMRWEQVYPENGHATKPLLLMSDKYRARQAEWAETAV
jgi:hypothetical protein